MSKKLHRIIINYLGIILGSFLTAMGLALFLIPNKIASGGVSGFATVLHYVFDVPVGTVILLVNIPLFLLAVKVLGHHVGTRTLVAIVVLSFSIDFLSPYLPVLTNDPLLASLYGGILSGIGMGIVFKAGGTTGGTDLIAALIHEFFPIFSLGQGLLLVDGFVILLAGIVFGAELALYAIIGILILSKFIDFIQEGLNYSKAAFIISEKAEEIKKKIVFDMDRGATILEGRGGYTDQKKEVLLVIIARSEHAMLKKIISGIDEHAFVIMTEVQEVLGEGFRELKKDR